MSLKIEMASKNNKRLRDRLAVCSWSLQPATPTVLIERMQAIGLRRIQCALDPIRSLPEIWVSFAQRLSDARMDLVSGMFGCVGEDYSSLESIRKTGGIVPDETWDENWENIQAVADIAKRLRLRLVTFHAGFLPHDPNDPGYEAMIHRMRLIAGVFAARGINVALETGQETAETLSRFLEDLGRSNVGVNFDPANMLLYDKGDPIEALRVLGPWLRQCHLKDAIRTQVPGTWGQEVTVGTGDVDWPAFFKTLEELNYTGPLCFEREAGEQRVDDIRAGREFVEGLEKVERSPKPVAAPVSETPVEILGSPVPALDPVTPETVALPVAEPEPAAPVEPLEEAPILLGSAHPVAFPPEPQDSFPASEPVSPQEESEDSWDPRSVAEPEPGSEPEPDFRPALQPSSESGFRPAIGLPSEPVCNPPPVPKPEDPSNPDQPPV